MRGVVGRVGAEEAGLGLQGGVGLQGGALELYLLWLYLLWLYLLSYLEHALELVHRAAPRDERLACRKMVRLIWYDRDGRWQDGKMARWQDGKIFRW